MSKKVFINLPVGDLKKATDFYSSIGFNMNSQFSDDTASAMVWSEEIYVMLLTHDKFKQFINKEIGNTTITASVINCLSLDSADEVNKLAEKAIAAGGKETIEAKDYGFMQQRSFEDPDGNLWEVMYMDLSKFPRQ